MLDLEVGKDFTISIEESNEWLAQTIDERKIMSRIKAKFETIKKKDETIPENEKLLKFDSAFEMYKWYLSQNKQCAYCEIEERKLKTLFTSNVLKSKRKRGLSLGIERRNSITNHYSPTNCVLACYVCNNTKSDFINEADFKKYFVPAISEYLADKCKDCPPQ